MVGFSNPFIRDFCTTLDTSNLLIYLLILPLIGALIILLIPSRKFTFIVFTGLLFSILTFLGSIILFFSFNKLNSNYQFLVTFNLYNENWESWTSMLNLGIFSLGVDGLALVFVLLTTLIIPLCILYNYNSVIIYFKENTILFLVTETLLLLVFLVTDLFWFYVFFESILIPMFLIIGVWGSRSRKIHAAYQFFMYTLFGSVLMLVCILYIDNWVYTTDFYTLAKGSIYLSIFKNKLLWLIFFFAFAVKVPMIPVHIWLPEAHVEAPTTGSVLLAGILLKMGTYGMLRVLLPIFPLYTIYFSPLVHTLALIGVIYGSCTTIRQIDLKKIIAYSSVVHMNFALLGLFTQTHLGIEGSILLMLNHGIVSSALFFGIGIIYDRYKTRNIRYFGNVVKFMPVFAVFFFITTLANMGFPGTGSFISEFFILIGIFDQNAFVAIMGSLGLILGAIFCIWLYNRVFFGLPNKNVILYKELINDLSAKECIVFIPFTILIILLGVYPIIISDYLTISVSHILSNLLFIKLEMLNNFF